MRIVSLLPSTTEILFAIGAGDDVVGVTFECDTPVEARGRTIVSTSAMPEGLSPKEIDDFVARAMKAGDDLYHLDAGALATLDADLVVTQDIPLAAQALDKGAAALNPRGERYTRDNIAQRLSMRNFMDELRGAGVQTGGPPVFHARDRQAFANQLDRWLAARR